MKDLSQIESWAAVSKKAYWDRDVPLEKWRQRVSIGHRSYLPDAVSNMDVAEFVHYYGARKFAADWPLLRTHLTEKALAKAFIYDLAWSRLTGGGWNLHPSIDFYSMPERRRQFWLAVSKTPGMSIYEVAKTLGMQYRRSHEHAVNLMESGKIRGKAVFEGGRRKMRVYPAYSSGASKTSAQAN